MASNEAVQWAKFRVGLLGITALFFITLLVFLLTGGSDWFSRKTPLHAYASDAAGLTAGAPVRINGIQAGKVNSVALSGDTDPQRIIKIDFEVDSDMLRQIPVDSLASVGSDNLLGSTKFLDITKGVRPETLQPNATMRSQNTAQFDQLVKQGFGVLDSAQAILGKIQDLLGNIESGKGTIGKFLIDPTLYNSLQSTVGQVQLLATTLNSRTGTLGQLINDPAVYKKAQSVLTTLDQITTNLQQGQGTAGQLITNRKLYDELDKSVTQLNQVLTNLNAGKGTAGQLFASDKIGNQVSATLDKVNLTIDKMNSGQGTIGQLLVNPQLYEQATGTTRELHDTLRDFRANPKKFLSIRLKIF